MSSSLPPLEFYKLETHFHDGYVTSPTASSSRRTNPALQNWHRQRKLGFGAAGVVWLECSDSGQLRAVKSIPRHHLPMTGFSQELLALITLADASTMYPAAFCDGSD